MLSPLTLPSPQRGEGRVRGPIVKKINAFVLINQFVIPQGGKGMEGSLKVTKNISVLIARTQLGQILERVKKNQDRFLISKKGEATAVILSVEDYLKNIVKQPDVLTKLQEQAKKAGTDKFSLEDIDAEIKAFRKGL
jgi:prevent-host-death family protein